jgi:nitroreductase
MIGQESYVEAFRQRYGQDPSAELESIAPFLRHRSVRRYADQPIDRSLIEGLVAAAQSASTSSNLQLWSIVSVQDPDNRKRILPLAANQTQVATAPWFFVFLADTHRLAHAAESAGFDPANLDLAEFYTMAVVDAALAAERMVVTAEHHGIGACYIGAMRDNPAGVTEALNLPEGVFALFGLCLGYPLEGRVGKIKPKLAQSEIWFEETYPESIDLSEYDARATAFNLDQKIQGPPAWSTKSGERLNTERIGSRADQLEWLQSIGLIRR